MLFSRRNRPGKTRLSNGCFRILEQLNPVPDEHASEEKVTARFYCSLSSPIIVESFVSMYRSVFKMFYTVLYRCRYQLTVYLAVNKITVEAEQTQLSLIPIRVSGFNC